MLPDFAIGDGWTGYRLASRTHKPSRRSQRALLIRLCDWWRLITRKTIISIVDMMIVHYYLHLHRELWQPSAYLLTEIEITGLD
jgi:hypothetical protein